MRAILSQINGVIAENGLVRITASIVGVRIIIALMRVRTECVILMLIEGALVEHG